VVERRIDRIFIKRLIEISQAHPFIGNGRNDNFIREDIGVTAGSYFSPSLLLFSLNRRSIVCSYWW
jgi:hypothetical protein